MHVDSFPEGSGGPIQARVAATSPHSNGKPLGWFPSLAIEYSVKLLHEHRLRTSTEGQDSVRHHTSHRTLHCCRGRRSCDYESMDTLARLGLSSARSDPLSHTVGLWHSDE